MFSYLFLTFEIKIYIFEKKLVSEKSIWFFLLLE
jgi:hypothetical protein